MLKKLTFVLVVLITFLFLYREKPKKQNISFSDLKNGMVISTNHKPVSESIQNFLVYPLDSKKTQQLNVSNLEARIETTSANGSKQIFQVSKPDNIKAFPLKFACKIPDSKKLTFSLYTNGSSNSPVISKDFIISENPGLVVIPPKQATGIAEWLNLRIFCFSKRTLEGLYKRPVRVKFTTPNGHTTVNRIITTELDGTAFFSTYIAEGSPQGLYKCEFLYGKNKLELKVPIRQQKPVYTTRVQTSNNRFGLFAWTSSKTQNDTTYKILPLPDSKAITKLRFGNQQLNFNFDCNNAEFRAIEVWQNGKLLNNSLLPIPKGRSSHPLPHNTDFRLPITVKLWTLKNKLLNSETHTILDTNSARFLPQSFISALNQSLNIDSKKIVNIFFSDTNNIFTGKHFNVAAGFDSTFLYLEPSMKENPELVTFTGRSVSKTFYDISQIPAITVGSIFFIVREEFDLKKYNFSSLKILVNPDDFYETLLEKLTFSRKSIISTITELETRLLRFYFLPEPQKKLELEKMEGLLIPVTEYLFTENNSSTTAIDLATKKRCYRLLKNLQKFIHLPTQAQELLKDSTSGSLQIGPLKGLVNFSASKELLESSLKPGGKILVEKANDSFTADLTKNQVEYKNRNFSNNSKNLKKLINLRNDPVVIELKFSGKDD